MIQDFVPVVDSIAGTVIHIDFPPRYKPKTSEPLFAASGLNVALSQPTTVPPPFEADAFAAANRPRIPPPMKSHEWLPDHLAKDKDFKFRDDIKPLHVLQPEGVSFKVDGHVLEWQKWKMHVGESSVTPVRGRCDLTLGQRSTTARASRFRRSLTTTTASSGPSSTASRSPRWSFLTARRSILTLGSTRLTCRWHHNA